MAYSSSLPVKLTPFHYQVGGHFILMSIDDSYVCKPLGSREHLFYHSIPTLLKDFVPQYQGIVVVHFIKNGEGTFDHVAVETKVIPPTTVVSKNEKEKNEMFRLLKTSFVATEECYEMPFVIGNSFCNPLTEKRIALLSKELDKLKFTELDYLVLEDLTRHFIHPSIIDLKIGTRSHGDLKTEKLHKHKERVSVTSTSMSLGVRFSGMMVYKVNSKCYNFHSKVIGRSMKSLQELSDILTCFIFDGIKYRIDVVKEIIQRLKRLRDVIRQLDTYRFFASSLLIVYESDPTVPLVVDVKIIDFENITHSGYNDSIQYEGPDEGFLLGLESLISIFDSVL